MTAREAVRAALAWALALLVAGCGGGGTSGDAGTGGTGGSTGSVGTGGTSSSPPPAGSDYLPLGQGNRWVYQRSEAGTATATLEQVDVGAAVDVGGAAVTSLVTSAFDGTQLDLQRYASTADGITEHPVGTSALETAVGPYPVLRLPVRVGSTYTQIDKALSVGTDSDGDRIPEKLLLLSTVQVISVAALTTPAGTFPATVHLRTTLDQTLVYSATGDRSTQRLVEDTWYAAGVGPVKRQLASASGSQLQPVSASVLVAWRVGRAHGGAAPAVVDVAPDGSRVNNGGVAVTASFSMPMDAPSLDAGGFGVVDAAGRAVPGQVALSPDGMSAAFVPANGWPSGTYTATVSAAATDRQSNAAQPRSWSFTLDATRPALAITAPADGATQVATDAALRFVFSEPLDLRTVLPSGTPAFFITDDGTGLPAPATASFDGTATLGVTPTSTWAHGRSYTVTFSGGIADLVGNTLGADRRVRFTTLPSVFAEPEPLGAATDSQPVVAIGDVDGDGWTDLVWTAYDTSAFPAANHLYVRYGQPDGRWGPPTEPRPAPVSGCGLATITIADTDADGRNDIVLGGNCGIDLLRQDASRRFAAGTHYALPGYDYAAAVRFADLDGDGRVEMLSAGNSSSFRVWTRTGTGVFQQTAFIDTGLGALVDLRVVDLDGDGVLDIVATSIGMQAERIAVLRGLRGGGFAAPERFATDGAPGGLGIGDVDGDGRLDIVVAIAGFDVPTVRTYRQQADHGYAMVSSVRVGTNPLNLALVDADGDGRLDVLLGHDAAFSVMRGRGDGTFAAEDLYGVPPPGGSGFVYTPLATSPPEASGRFVVGFNGQVFVRSAPRASTLGLRARAAGVLANAGLPLARR